jgi:glycosyltransferase involved in cell wall biosynthesis
MTPLVSVIICTHNRVFLLKETLPNIFIQNVDKDLYNVIVVDNNSTDGTAKYLLEQLDNFDNLFIINEDQIGLGFARNTGYEKANSEWIIYLDDDAIVPQDFLKIAIDIINSKQYNCFGGVYTPWYKYGRPKWYKDYYASTLEFVNNDNLKNIAYASGGIFAIKKLLLEKFGGFPTNIGMKGNSISYGEETQLQIKLKKSGHEIGIIPKWQMKHLVNKYKLNIWWFILNGYVTGRDAWIIYKEDISIKKIGKYFFRFVKGVIVLPFTNLLKLNEKDYYLQNWFIESYQPISTNLGRVWGGIKILLSNND